MNWIADRIGGNLYLFNLDKVTFAKFEKDGALALYEGNVIDPLFIGTLSPAKAKNILNRVVMIYDPPADECEWKALHCDDCNMTFGQDAHTTDERRTAAENLWSHCCVFPKDDAPPEDK